MSRRRAKTKKMQRESQGSPHHLFDDPERDDDEWHGADAGDGQSPLDRLDAGEGDGWSDDDELDDFGPSWREEPAPADLDGWD